MHYAAIEEENLIEEHQQEEAIQEEEIEELEEMTEEMEIKTIGVTIQVGNAEFVMQAGIII